MIFKVASSTLHTSPPLFFGLYYKKKKNKKIDIALNVLHLSILSCDLLISLFSNTIALIPLKLSEKQQVF